LKTLGKEVKNLILIDTYAQQNEHKEGWMQKLLDRFKKGIVKRGNITVTPASKVARKTQIKKERWKTARNNYQLPFYDGHIHLLRAQTPSANVQRPYDFGWAPYVNKVNVLEVEAEPVRLSAPSNTVKLAKMLQKSMDT